MSCRRFLVTAFAFTFAFNGLIISITFWMVCNAIASFTNYIDKPIMLFSLVGMIGSGSVVYKLWNKLDK